MIPPCRRHLNSSLTTSFIRGSCKRTHRQPNGLVGGTSPIGAISRYLLFFFIFIHPLFFLSWVDVFGKGAYPYPGGGMLAPYSLWEVGRESVLRTYSVLATYLFHCILTYLFTAINVVTLAVYFNVYACACSTSRKRLNLGRFILGLYQNITGRLY